MFRPQGLNQESRGNTATPTNYLLLSLPVKWVNNKTCSHALFIKTISWDRWTDICVYVTNESRNSFYRLQACTNSHNNSAEANTASEPWIGPDGGMSHGNKAHEWLMFSIPEYVVENYSFSETWDTKSTYERNIQLALVGGYGTSESTAFWISGIAMRTNPYGLTFHNMLGLHWYTNGGGQMAWYSGSWNQGILGEQTSGTNVTNIYIPICPRKDPDIYGYPDFYLGIIGHRADGQWEHKPRWYLQHSNGTYKYLGRPSRMYGGRYGKNMHVRADRCNTNVGVYVPSPDPAYIVKVLGRPYLRVRIDNSVIGWDGSMHLKGVYTEMVYADGTTTDGLGWGGQMYI